MEKIRLNCRCLSLVVVERVLKTACIDLCPDGNPKDPSVLKILRR